jgi:hypothetical protein
MLNCGSATEPEEGDFPTNLNVEKHSNFSVKLFWEYEAADSDTIFYQIARKVGIAEWVENYAQISSDFNEFIDYIPTTSNNVYAYKVRYFNSTLDITSPYSETIAWFSENTYPSDMLIIQLTQETIQVTWSDMQNGKITT